MSFWFRLFHGKNADLIRENNSHKILEATIEDIKRKYPDEFDFEIKYIQPNPMNTKHGFELIIKPKKKKQVVYIDWTELNAPKKPKVLMNDELPSLKDSLDKLK